MTHFCLLLSSSPSLPGDCIAVDMHLLPAIDFEIDKTTGEATAFKKGVMPCSEGTEMTEQMWIAYMGKLVWNSMCFHPPFHKQLTIQPLCPTTGLWT